MENQGLYKVVEVFEEDGLKFHKLDLKFRGQRVKVYSDVMKIMNQFSLSDLQKA